ncbi:TPA: hypothetical protein F8R85_15790 [Legionella pneumophila]|nr:hypothetical protein [Legionella pneumophila]HAU1500498.1 hypothetical protein [Legionella pneumophila]HAU1519494.1 hypothetical protein [Legionella pneumophila]
MIKKFILIISHALVLIPLMFLLASCTSATSKDKEDSKNNTQHKRVFSGYHPHGHGHGHH